MTDVTSWAPTVSALTAVTALAVNTLVSTFQQIGDRKISANSVLISLGSTENILSIFNGGKYPILNIDAFIGGKRVSGIGEQTYIGASETRMFEVDRDQLPSASFPHDVTVYFTDARGKRWRRDGHRLATRMRTRGRLWRGLWKQSLK